MSESNFGLTSSGLRLPRSADWLEIIRDDFESRVEAGPIDWSRQTVFGPMSVTMAERLGKCSEMLQAVYDSRSPNNANGVQLDDICQLALTSRDEATKSSVTLTLTSGATASNTFIDIGTLVAGGGDDGRARWSIIEEATIPGAGGTVNVIAEAVDEGPVAAGIASITKILTPVEGWASVTNAAAAVLGRAEESDPSVRRRFAEAPFRAGRATVKSLRERLRDLESLTAASVVENDTADEVVSGALTLPGHSVAVVVWPTTLTDAEKVELAQVLFEAKGGGIQMIGTQEAEVTFGSSSPFTVRWNYATADAIPAAVALTLYPGFDEADAIAAVEDIVVEYFSELLPGEDVERDELICRIRDNVPGVKSSAVTLDGVAADYVVGPTFIATLDGTPAVTVP